MRDYIIFFGLVSLMLGGLSLAISAFFGHAFLLHNSTFTIAGMIWLSTLAFPVGTWVAEKTGNGLLKTIGAISLGMVALLVCTTTLGWIGLLLPVPKQVIGFLVVGVSVNLGLWSLVNALLPQRITSIKQVGTSPIRIVQLTDIHLDGITPTWWVRRLVNDVRGLDPDMIVFTGDLLDIAPNHVSHQLEILEQLPARLGKFAVSGNHDFYLGYPIYQQVLKQLGFTLIDNQQVQLHGLTIAGVPDPDAERFGFGGAKLPVLSTGADQRAPLIFLSHRPDPFPAVAGLGRVFQLSGHTHWGQIPPFGIITRWWHQFSRGYHQRQDSSIYVAKGTGVWGPPMRLFGRSEIVVIDILPPPQNGIGVPPRKGNRK